MTTKPVKEVEVTPELIELSGYMSLGKDDTWEGYEPSEVNSRKIYDMFKREILIKDPSLYKWIEEHTKETVYNTCKKIPIINIAVYYGGFANLSEFKKIIEGGINEYSKKYGFILDASEELIENSWLPVVTAMRKIKSEGLTAATKVDTSKGIISFDLPKDEKERKLIDSLLSNSKIPSIEDIYNSLGIAKMLEGVAKEKEKDLKLTKKELKELEEKLKEMSLKSSLAASIQTKVEASGEVPEGKVVLKKASEVFNMKFKNDFEIPTFEWDGKHPYVPEKDLKYIFRETELTRLLYGIVTNQRIYLQGDTGTGKTTLVEQAAAYMNYPFVRINFDSEITRDALIGRDKLSRDGDITVSEFIDGILPTAMSLPCFLCCDEVDFVRPDVAYVMQSALEGNGLRIMEDGDRLVEPHPMFRMFATGNTVGQGDERGMYQGARPQSLAFLDRFTVWIRVEYLKSEHRVALLKDWCPALSGEDTQKIDKYVEEHLASFLSSKVLQPISPRGMIAIGMATPILGLKESVSMVVLDRATDSDRITLKGIVDRVI